LRHPEFVRFFVVDQHLARYLWTTEHGQPFWFYLPLLPVAFGPWSIALLCDPAALGAVRTPRQWSSATRFLAWWAAAVVLFFSLSASKLATYILPALPPLAILTARAWQLAVTRGRTAGLVRIGWLFLLLAPLVGLTAVVLPIAHPHWRMPLIAPVLLAAAPVLFATGVAIGRCCARGRPLAAFAVLTAGWFAVLAIALGGRRAANEYRILGVTAHAAMRPEDRLAIYGSYVEGIPFYAERRVIMVVGRGELTFGSEHGDQAAFFWPSAAALQREWAAPGRLFLVAKPPDLAQLTPPLDPPPILLATKNDKVLVVNRAP
jgi:4-amino-4-deoxy-L-arabinose transferase-like glycosyltransferase